MNPPFSQRYETKLEKIGTRIDLGDDVRGVRVGRREVQFRRGYYYVSLGGFLENSTDLLYVPEGKKHPSSQERCGSEFLEGKSTLGGGWVVLFCS